MPDSDNYLGILLKISSDVAVVAADVAALKNEIGHVKEGISETKNELGRINEQDIHQNSLLDQHILGVKTAMGRLDNEIEARQTDKALISKQIEEIDKRLKKREVLPTFAHQVSKIVKWLCAIAIGAAAAIEVIRFFH